MIRPAGLPLVLAATVLATLALAPRGADAGATRATGAARRATVNRAYVVDVPAGGDVVGAMAQVDAAGGGTVNLAAGTYLVRQPILMGSNTTLTGQGAATVITEPPTPRGWDMIDAQNTSVSNLVIQNLVLDGNIPLGAYLQAPSGSAGNPYSGAGIEVFTYGAAIEPMTVSNVEIRNFGIGMLLGTVDDLTLSHVYVHDNNPGNFAHDVYLVACSNVSIDHSRFDVAHDGDGLHFDFGASNYLISKSEFNGNAGEGILDEGNSGITVEDSIANWNGDNGVDDFSNGSLRTRDLTSGNSSYGMQQLGGSGTYVDLAGFGNVEGWGQIFGVGGYGSTVSNVLTTATPNVYPAILANGPLGIVDTADWTNAYAGYSTVGAVDFNANHLANGSITFPAVGAVGSGSYTLTFRYSNGSPNAVVMPLTVNRAKLTMLSFPSTGNASAWSTVSVTAPLSDGNNVVSLRALSSGAPELDYLQVLAPVPAPPSAPARVGARAVNPYAVLVSWPAVPGASTYSVLRASPGGAFSTIAAGLTSTSYTDKLIRFGNSTFSYAVEAVNQGGASVPGSAVTATTPIDAPAGLQAAPVSGGNALNWMSANGAASYDVARSTTSGGPYRHLATVANTTSLMSSSFEQTYTDTTANPATTYFYVVSAEGGPYHSRNSYEVSVAGSAAAAVRAANADIATLGLRGRTSYDGARTYGVSGFGTGLRGTADGFHYAYTPVRGDVSMTARVEYVSGATPAQAGIDLRSSLDPGASNVFVGLGPPGAFASVRSSPNRRAIDAGAARGIRASVWVRLTRTGDVFTTAFSWDGRVWNALGMATVAMPRAAYLGLAVSSTVPNRSALALFDEVSTSDPRGKPGGPGRP